MEMVLILTLKFRSCISHPEMLLSYSNSSSNSNSNNKRSNRLINLLLGFIEGLLEPIELLFQMLLFTLNQLSKKLIRKRSAKYINHQWVRPTIQSI